MVGQGIETAIERSRVRCSNHSALSTTQRTTIPIGTLSFSLSFHLRLTFTLVLSPTLLLAHKHARTHKHAQTHKHALAS